MPTPTRQITGTFLDSHLQPAAGETVKFVPLAYRTDTVNKVRIDLAPVKVTLDGYGKIPDAFTLVCTDASGVQPTPVGYQVFELFGSRETYYINVPSGSGALDMADLAQLQPPPPGVSTFASEADLLAEASARQTADLLLLPLDGTRPMTGDLPLGGHKATGAADATTATGLTTLQQMQAAITAAVNGLLNGAPGALDTLKELADALGDDASFATTVTNALALKAPISTTTIDLVDRTNNTTETVPAGTTTNCSTAGVTKTAPALAGSVGTPPLRFAVKNLSTGNITVAYPDQAGAGQSLVLLPAETRTFRQKSTSGWGVESGAVAVATLDARYASLTDPPRPLVLTDPAYGGKCDGVLALDGAVTSGLTTFTSAKLVPFTGSKTVFIDGAGAAGVTLQTTLTCTVSGTGTLGVAASTTVSNAMAVWGTDDTAAWAAVMTAWFNQGGGDIYTPGITIASQIVVPNDGTSSAANQTCAYQPPGRIRGKGGWFNGEWSGLLQSYGSIVVLYGATAPAKIDTRGSGMLEVDHLTLLSIANDSNPIWQTTNTDINPHHIALVGRKSLAGQSCLTDGIILGGTSVTIGNGSNAPFQGYSSQIEGPIYADHIRRPVVGQAYCNGLWIRGITVSTSCGNAAGTGCIEFTGVSSGVVDCGNVIGPNTVESPHYPYVVRFTNANNNTVFSTSAFDPTGTTLAVVRCESGSVGNLIIDGFHPGALPALSDANSTRSNFALSPQSGLTEFLNVAFALNAYFKTSTTEAAALVFQRSGTNEWQWYQNSGANDLFLRDLVNAVMALDFSNTSQLMTVGYQLVASKGIVRAITSGQTSSYAIAVTDDVVVMNGTSLTATLPGAGVVRPGKVFTIKNLNSSPLTIATTSSQTIDGAAPGTLAQWAILRVISNGGSSWYTI